VDDKVYSGNDGFWNSNVFALLSGLQWDHDPLSMQRVIARTAVSRANPKTMAADCRTPRLGNAPQVIALLKSFSLSNWWRFTLFGFGAPENA